MIDDESEARIVEKAEHIEEAVISRKQSLELEEYLDDREQRAIVEREFQTAIEACIDIAQLLLTAAEVAVPETNAETFARGSSMTDRAVLAAVVAAAALLVAGVGPAAAAPPSLSCVDGDTGAVYAADAGLVVSDDAGSAALTADPVVNDTTLAFANVTVQADGDATAVLETARADRLCAGPVNGTATPVTLAPDGFASVTVEGRLAGLSYGPISYDAGTVDLAYSASAQVTLTLAGVPANATTVRAVDAETNETLANATVDDSGRVTLSLPADNGGVDLRTGGEPTPSLSVSVSPASITAGGSTAVAATVTDAATGGPVENATVAIGALGVSATTNATGVAVLSVRADPGNYTVTAAAERYRDATTAITVTNTTVPPGAVYDPGSVAATYDGAGGQRDGRISIGELGEAAADYATGDVTIAELGDVAAAYAQS